MPNRWLSLTITERSGMRSTKAQKVPPVSPGEILLEEFIKPHGLNANRVALALRVPATRVAEIISGQRAISPDTAIRLGRYFNTSAKFWMNLQTGYDLRKWEQRILPEVERDVTPISAL